jgi:L-fucose mutarotase
MLKHQLIHPEINQILGGAGHHSKILIADGNYPATSKLGPNARVVHLNLMPGLVTCNQVLQAILSAVPIEAVNTMMYEKTGPYALSEDPGVWSDYPIEKWKFYEAVATPDHVLTVQTADQQRFANILLTIGVRMD